MNATLFSEIQRLFERTYATVGINLEDCLIDGPRCGQLSRAAGASARELSELARTFLRNGGRPAARRHLLFALADRPARTARPSEGSQRHEHPLADRVRGGDRPRAARRAPVPARAPGHRQRGFRAQPRTPGAGGHIPRAADVRGVFPQGAKGFPHGPALAAVPSLRAARSRRPTATRTCAGVISKPRNWPSDYTRYLDTLNGLRRLEEIRAFHALDYAAKKQRILALPAPTRDPVRTRTARSKTLPLVGRPTRLPHGRVR